MRSAARTSSASPACVSMPLSMSRQRRGCREPTGGPGPSPLGDPSAKQPVAEPPEGICLPNLSDVLDEPDTGWQQVMVPGWYGDGERIVDALLGHRRVAPRRPAGRADPPGAGARSDRPVRAAGSAMHRPGLRAGADPALVRPALADRGHVPKDQSSPGRRNPASMVGPGHRTHHAMPARVVFHRDPTGGAPRAGSATTTAWYRKQCPTFSDTLAAVRRHIWREQGLLMSRRQTNTTKPQPALQRAMADALCHAA